MATKSGRTIIAEQKFSWKIFFLKWMVILLLILKNAWRLKSFRYEAH